MFKQQCKCKFILNVSQLRLVPKVGQWGQLMFEGGLLQEVYKLNKLSYPQTQGYNYLQKNTKCYNDYTIYKDITRYKK